MEEIWVSSFRHPEKYYSKALWSPGLSPAADLPQGQGSRSWPQKMPIHCRESFPGVILLGTSSARIKAGTVPWEHPCGIGRWDGDGEAGPFLFDRDTKAPEHTAVGSSPLSGLGRTEPGQWHNPCAAECCGSWRHREFLVAPPKAWCSPPAPQGTAPSARWVSGQPPGRAAATWRGLGKLWAKRE